MKQGNVLVSLSFLACSSLFAVTNEGKELKQLETLLDKLDKKVQQDESESFSQQGQKSLRKEKVIVAPTLNISSKKDTTHINQIESIAKNLKKVNSEIDKLETEFISTQAAQNSKQEMKSIQKIYLAFSPELQGYEISRLKFDMNGVHILKTDNEDSLTAQNSDLPLFEGPISSGEIETKLEIDLAKQNGTTSSVKEHILTLDKSLVLNISNSQNYKFTLTRSSKDESQLKIDVSILK